MEEIFTHVFTSRSILLLIFVGLTFVGSALGFCAWIDFGRRFAEGGRRAGTIVWVSGTLIGLVTGYVATQPAYFRQIQVDANGVELGYFWPPTRVRLAWAEIDDIEVLQDRLVVEAEGERAYASAVVFRGDQAELIRSIEPFLPDG